MVVDYLDYIVGQVLPAVFKLLNTLMIANAVSWLGLGIAVTLLCVLIGSILMRVS